MVFLQHIFSPSRSDRNKPVPDAATRKIEVFSRHCIFSSISAHKKRFPHFSREQCYRNLLETIDFSKANLTFFLDTAKGARSEHFLKDETRCPVMECKEGSEAGSFLRLLERVEKLDFHPDTLLYFVEDDYLHRPGWIDVLLEAFQCIGPDYATLYDHRDKYTSYPKLKSTIYATSTCHWRTVPSTTNTFAVRFETLLKDLKIHRRFSNGRPITKDHDKFCFLQKKGASLISPMPGWSTHAEPEYASPCIDWQPFINQKEFSYVFR